jgi:23S rRNA (cytosine1962-C5)-methyltransferase
MPPPPQRRRPRKSKSPTDGPPPPPGSEKWPAPWAQIKSFRFNPAIFKSMLGPVSPDARAGDFVTVIDPEGNPFGEGLLNNLPSARISLRVLRHGPAQVGEAAYFDEAIERALELRGQWLGLGQDLARTNTYRVIHSDGDSLSGWVVDRFGDSLLVQVNSLGIWQRLGDFLPRLHAALGTRRHRVQIDPEIARMEGIRGAAPGEDPALRSERVVENGVRYEVNFETGHKTGFFCDQRENRRRLAQWTQGKRVLDLCCYTGGFSLAAMVRGGADSVTGVDLDEKAIAQAKRNANLNQARIKWVHADAFAYARQMQTNGEQFDVVVLDPPKLILSREERRQGERKYEDLNELAASLVVPGGLFVTCSCSGLLSLSDFERVVTRGVHRAQRRLQYLDLTGAGGDHPILSNCPESQYLKVYWGRVW